MIIVLSDTHNYQKLSNKLVSKYRNNSIDAIIHCGDVTDFSLFELYAKLTKNIYYVKGNNDRLDLDTAKILRDNGVLFSIQPFEFHIEHYGYFVIMHEPYFIEEYQRKRHIDYILYGHTHIVLNTIRNNKKIINPGSFSHLLYMRSTYAIIEMDGTVKIKKDIH